MGIMRILVVEDEMKMAKLLRKGLEEEGYAVDHTADGSEAVWYGTENDYDAAVLDVMLPDTNGFDVCRAWREAGRAFPVLMLTARGGVGDRVTGLDAGADDYLTKPFSFEELLARLRALLRRGEVRPTTTLEVDGLRLDPARHEVHRGEERIDLTAKEFALLEYLMRNAGRVLSRSQLIEHVWDFAYEGDSNVVDVYVRYLREKIDRPFETHSIETVRGVGYRIREAS